MSEPAYMRFIAWPECDACRSTGIAAGVANGWPAECVRCKSARERAVVVAQRTYKNKDKAGEL